MEIIIAYQKCDIYRKLALQDEIVEVVAYTVMLASFFLYLYFNADLVHTVRFMKLMWH